MKIGQRIDAYRVIDNDNMPLTIGSDYCEKKPGPNGPTLFGERPTEGELGWYLRDNTNAIPECKKVGTLIIKSIK